MYMLCKSNTCYRCENYLITDTHYIAPLMSTDKYSSARYIHKNSIGLYAN